MTTFCTNCGLCCMELSSPPFTNVDWERLPAELQAEVNRFLDSPRFIPDGNPCFWLDMVTGQCKHYDHRPDVCREFEVGSDTCREWRTSAKLTVEGMPVVEDDES